MRCTTRRAKELADFARCVIRMSFISRIEASNARSMTRRAASTRPYHHRRSKRREPTRDGTPSPNHRTYHRP